MKFNGADSFDSAYAPTRPLLAVFIVVLARPATAAPGTLDKTFSGNGIATVFPGGATAEAVAVDGQDRVVVAGHTYGASVDVAVVRLRWNGSLDGTFGVTGGSGSTSARRSWPSTSPSPRTGRSSWSGTAPCRRPSVVRDAAPPERVARRHVRRGRRRVHGFGRPFEQANAVAIHRAGRSSSAGRPLTGSMRTGRARYLSGGALDRTFGGDGRVSLSLSQTGEEVQDLLIEARASSPAATRSGRTCRDSRSRSCGSTAPGRPRSARRGSAS